MILPLTAKVLGLTLIIAMFCYQVAFGTNESSYKWGYNSGKIYPSIRYMSGSCNLNSNAAELKIWAAAGLTNRTACVDGWFNGWKDWCSNHAVD